MKKLLVIFCTVLCFANSGTAQDYNTGIGLRGGYGHDYGLTVKHFLGADAAVEGILHSRWQGFSITGLYEIHIDPFSTDRLRVYYGIGGHLGSWNGRHVHWADDDRNYTVIGIDGIIGLEYTFTEAPINIGIDWKPAFNLIGYSGFWGDAGALSVRYTF